MSESVGIGVLGARSMVAGAAVLPAIDASPLAYLAATASLGGPVPEPWSHTSVEDYDAVIEHPDVEAVYVPLPNDLHRHWVVRAAAAGKHVLCEKPIAPNVDDAHAMHAACETAGVVLAEAWMTPFDPRWAHTMQLAADGLIGDIVHVDSAFTFTIGPEATENYRWKPEHGGGALLDVGIYCLGPAVQLWGSEPVDIESRQEMSATGVDAFTTMRLTWDAGQVATARCSFVDDERQRLEIVGTAGTLVLDGDAHTGGTDAEAIRHVRADGAESTITIAAADPYRHMVERFAGAVRGTQHWPRPIQRSMEMLALIERIRDAAT